jgi:hypothetical protein
MVFFYVFLMCVCSHSRIKRICTIMDMVYVLGNQFSFRIETAVLSLLAQVLLLSLL